MMNCFSTFKTSQIGYSDTIKVIILVTVIPVATNKWSPPSLAEHIQSIGYPVEVHNIVTEDGYILTYHRIPDGKNGKKNKRPKCKQKRKLFSRKSAKKPVLVKHGLIGSSAGFALESYSLGFVLADHGYDVWLANSRGNTFSRKHVALDPDVNNEFWDFSFHEMGYYDLPAAIDFILNKTGHDKLFYAGFSMGTTEFFVLGSTRPGYMSKIHVAVLACPIVQPWHMRSFIVRMATYAIFLLRNYNEVFSLDKFGWYETHFCNWWIVKHLGICKYFNHLIAGGQGNLKTVPSPIIQKFLPAGTSWKTFDHMKQITRQDFSQYNYGQALNLHKYGNLTPPKYNLSHATAPIYIIYAMNDWLSVPEDVQFSARHIPSVKSLKEITNPDFNHYDFIFAYLAKPLAYDYIVKVFKDLCL